MIKLLVWLTFPLNLSLGLLVCAGVAWALRSRVLGRVLIGFALAWSAIWSVPQFSEWLRAPLERQHPIPSAMALPKADAIVVLGGGSLRTDRLDGSRLAAAAKAWAAGRAPVVILSGGRNASGRGRSEAERMRGVIVKFGVPESALILEERSSNTQENARFTAQLARGHGIGNVLLVTSSLHMPRASLLFREAGLDIVPVPVSEGSAGGTWAGRWIPTSRALWRSGRALKEYTGLLALHAGIE